MQTRLFYTTSICLLSLVSRDVEQEAQPAGQVALPTHTLTVPVREGRKLLVQYRSEFESSVVISAGERKIEVPTTIKESAVFVDEFTNVRGQEEIYDMRRTCLLWHTLRNGRQSDPPLTGVDLEYHEEGGQFNLSLGDRVVPKDTLSALLQQANSIALWAPLPSQVAVGDSIQVNLLSLVPFLLQSTGTIQVEEATLELNSVDESSLARLEGILRATEQTDVEGIPMTVSVAGPCSLSVDLRERVIREMTWSGSATVTGSTDVATVSGQGRYDIQVTAQTGAAVDEAMGVKTEYRLNQHVLKPHGLEFRLPSHWYMIPNAELGLFQTSLHGKDNLVVLEVKSFGGESAAIEVSIDEAEQMIRANSEGLVVAEVDSPFGKGRSLRCHSRAGEEFLIEFFRSSENRAVRIRLFGPPRGFRKQLEQFDAIRSSFRRLKSD